MNYLKPILDVPIPQQHETFPCPDCNYPVEHTSVLGGMPGYVCRKCGSVYRGRNGNGMTEITGDFGRDSARVIEKAARESGRSLELCAASFIVNAVLVYQANKVSTTDIVRRVEKIVSGYKELVTDDIKRSFEILHRFESSQKQ